MMTDIYDTLCESMPSAVQIMTHKLLQQLSIDNFRYLELAAQDTLFPIVCRLLVYREEKAEFVAEPAELTVPYVTAEDRQHTAYPFTIRHTPHPYSYTKA